MKIGTALTIAGSDCSGGAGIQADIKTMTSNGVYAMSAITALTAQNTLGVRSIMETSPGFLADQLDAVFEDIFPDAVKVGMVPSANLIDVVADKLKKYGARNIVVDPVMVATSGSRLMERDALGALTQGLFPIADLITPNIPEAEVLCGFGIANEKDMEKAVRYLGEKYGCSVLIKGGHRINDANDLLYHKGKIEYFYGKRVDNPNTHGTGCTLSSAIASGLAKGLDIASSVKTAKEYISNALSAMLDLGSGSGPLLHNYRSYYAVDIEQ